MRDISRADYEADAMKIFSGYDILRLIKRKTMITLQSGCLQHEWMFGKQGFRTCRDFRHIKEDMNIKRRSVTGKERAYDFLY